MAKRARGDKEYRLPFKGLNTEANLLDFPQDSAVDLLNLEVDLTPMRLKARLGHSSLYLTANDTTVGLPADSGELAYSWHLWENAGGDADSNFLIIQQGDRLLFCDADSDDMITILFGVYLYLDDIKSGTDKGTLILAERTPIQYSAVKGYVMITSEAIEPTLLRYNVSAATVSFTKLNLKVRDVVGLESGVEVGKHTVIGDFPVGDTVSALYPSMTEIHEYNLYNQGWYKPRRVAAGGATQSPISRYTVQLSLNPSNADIVHLAMVEDVTVGGFTQFFDEDVLDDITFGDSPAPRGHYIFNAFDIDRDDKILNFDESGAYTGGGGEGGGTDGSGWTDIPGTP